MAGVKKSQWTGEVSRDKERKKVAKRAGVQELVISGHLTFSSPGPRLGAVESNYQNSTALEHSALSFSSPQIRGVGSHCPENLCVQYPRIRVLLMIG